MTRYGIALALAAWAVQAAPVAGQATFRTRVDAVRLDVSVTRGGRPVPALTADDFDVTDSGVPQRVQTVSVDSLPVSVFLVLDTSGSVDDGLRDLVKAAQSLVAALRPGDRAALITFSTDVAVRVPLTADVASVNSALTSMSANGSTALNDAVFTALQLRPDDETRSMVLVFSDGADSASWLSEPDVLAAARRIPVVIHAIALTTDFTISAAGARSTESPRPPASLERLVAATGGNAWPATESGNLRALFTHALDEMRARYTLTYYAQGTAREGWHELKVRLKRGRADIKARPGYFVPPRQ